MRSFEFIAEENKPLKLSGSSGSSPAKEFIKKIRELGYINPLDDSFVILVSNKTGFVQFELKPSLLGPNYVHISFMQAHPEKSGLGTQGMRTLQQLAKEDGISLDLAVWEKGRIKPAVLTKFYKNMGFKPKKGGLLVWEPDHN
jgi:hypothetical protein